ncbi:nucleoside-diphosphate kinase [Candidatus Pacearchaeota archaeon]|nr:nucleoside-diphosphate kinase [Candidatus Pacearchaeota archaeon]
MRQTTFGMIKPESIKEGLETELIERIEGKGLKISGRIKRKLTREEVSILYGHVRESIPDIYPQIEEHFTINECILLKVEGDNSVNRLLDIRGASNPKDALPGSIRGDYAKNQDYEVLRAKRRVAHNYFHAAGTEEEARSMISCLMRNDF